MSFEKIKAGLQSTRTAMTWPFRVLAEHIARRGRALLRRLLRRGWRKAFWIAVIAPELTAFVAVAWALWGLMDHPSPHDSWVSQAHKASATLLALLILLFRCDALRRRQARKQRRRARCAARADAKGGA